MEKSKQSMSGLPMVVENLKAIRKELYLMTNKNDQHFTDLLRFEEMTSPMRFDINKILTIQGDLSQYFFEKYTDVNEWKDGVLTLTQENIDDIVVYTDIVFEYSEKLKEKIIAFDKFVEDAFARKKADKGE